MEPTRRGPAGVGGLVAIGALVFLAAVLMARLLLARGDLWKLFLLALPVVLVLLSLALGIPRALLLLGAFVAAVLGIRLVLEMEGAGWVILLLFPIVLLALMLGARVVRQLWRSRKSQRTQNGSD